MNFKYIRKFDFFISFNYSKTGVYRADEWNEAVNISDDIKKRKLYIERIENYGIYYTNKRIY